MLLRPLELEVLVVAGIVEQCAVHGSAVGCPERLGGRLLGLVAVSNDPGRGRTNEAMSPQLDHLHALGVPDVRLEPDLVPCLT